MQSTGGDHQWRPIDSAGEWHEPPTDGSIKKGRLERTIAALYERIGAIQRMGAELEDVTLKDRITPESMETSLMLGGTQIELQLHKNKVSALQAKVITHIQQDWTWLTSLRFVGGIFEFFRDRAIEKTKSHFKALLAALDTAENEIAKKLLTEQDYREVVFAINSAFPASASFHHILNKEEATDHLKTLSLRNPEVSHMLFRRDPANIAGLIISVKRKDSSQIEHIPIAVGFEEGLPCYIRIVQGQTQNSGSSVITGDLLDLIEAESWEEVAEMIGYP